MSNDLKNLSYQGRPFAKVNQKATKLPQPGDRPVMIGVPSGDMVHADFSFALTMLFGKTLSAGVPLGVTNIKGTLIDSTRNLIVQQALDHDCSHLLFIDSDMVFKEDALLWLLQQDKDIIGVTYSTRRAPFLLVHHNLRLGEGVSEYATTDADVRKLVHDNGQYPVAALPCGFMLIKTDVFKTIRDKYDHDKYIVGESKIFPWFATDCKNEIGEDIYFCRLARAAGFDIWLDVDLSRAVRHCGQHYYSIDDAKPADLQGNYL